MEINKIHKYNEGYINDMLNRNVVSNNSQNNAQVYNGPIVNGHISTIDEQFNIELQDYNTTDTEDKGHGRVLSPNNK